MERPFSLINILVCVLTLVLSISCKKDDRSTPLSSVITTTPTSPISRFYPSAFVKQLETKQKQNLKEKIFDVLTLDHQSHSNSSDTLGCTKRDTKGCYRHKSLSYDNAKKELFGTLHLEKDKLGVFVKDVYCNQVFRPKDTSIGKGEIPDHTMMNCEHTWPQIRFSKQFKIGIQKSDLHHLYPANSKANAVRGHKKFAEVKGKKAQLRDCSDSSAGKSGGRYFQPPAEHRGNVARALFYFSVRYQKNIDSKEEKVLRKWDDEDPIDAQEIKRNEMIYKIQKNRNPFIDFPNLADSITNF